MTHPAPRHVVLYPGITFHEGKDPMKELVPPKSISIKAVSYKSVLNDIMFEDCFDWDDLPNEWQHWHYEYIMEKLEEWLDKLSKQYWWTWSSMTRETRLYLMHFSKNSEKIGIKLE